MKQTFILARGVLLSVAFMLISIVSSLAQNQTIHGTVKDSFGEAVIGAAVIVEGTQLGIATDENGQFSLSIPNVTPQTTLNISYIGLKTVIVAVGSRTDLNVVMSEDAELALDAVQVVAYGTQTKKTITGAISSIQSADLMKSAANNVANTLAGALPGVSSIQSSGMPGETAAAIYIRGSGAMSDAAGAPLILVDGVERDFSQLDPNEIEDITVLKDASATSVFGVRGANGVILVTTRRGSEGEINVNITSQVGIATPTRLFDMADSYTFASTYNRVSMEEQGTQPFSDRVVEAFRTNSQPLIYPNVDWIDEAMKNAAFQTRNNLTVSGGNKDVRYFVSLGYLNEDGLFKDIADDFDSNYNYTRYNYRSNVDMNLTKSTVLKLSLGGVISKQIKLYEPAGYGPLGALYKSYPFAGAGIVDGKYYESDNARFNGMDFKDMGLQRLFYGFQDATRNNINLDVNLEQQLDFITEGLRFAVQGSYNSTYNQTKGMSHQEAGIFNQKKYIPYFKSELEDGMNFEADFEDPNFDATPVAQITGKDVPLQPVKISTGRNRDWYVQASLNYDRKFGDHKVGALALFNQSKNYYPSGNEWYIPYGYMGVVGRVTYDYKTRYLVDANIGYNGSENFAKKSRYGLFPSVSLGWVASEEKFMKNEDLYLKIRGSYGLVGNDRGMGRFLYLPSTWETEKGSISFGGLQGFDTYYQTAKEGNQGNADVSWETAIKYNVGFDMILWNNLNITADYFVENRSNILIVPQTMPSITALGYPNMNIGKVNNHGYEVEVSYHNTFARDFRTNISLNATYAKNKIIEMDELQQPYEHMMRTGHSTGEVYGYVFDRFYTEKDFDSNGNLIDGLPQPASQMRPGDPKYVDLSKDGVIDAYDKTYSGYGNRPEYVFGANISLGYKRFNFSMQWTAATHVDRNFESVFRSPFLASSNFFNFHVEDSWTPETAATATLPRLTMTNTAYSYENSTLWLRDASYIRLKNVVLEYSLKGMNFTKPLGINDLKVYVSAYNPLTIDKIKITDPEASTAEFAASSTNAYPLTKMYNVGVKINF